jgi:hypothetical protein
MQNDDSIGDDVPGRVDRLLLSEEIRSVVTEASASGVTLRIGPHAKRLSELREAMGLSQRSIADELIRVAAHAGVPVEMDRLD